MASLFIDLKCGKKSERMQMQKVKDTIKNATSYSSDDALKLFTQCEEIQLTLRTNFMMSLSSHVLWCQHCTSTRLKISEPVTDYNIRFDWGVLRLLRLEVDTNDTGETCMSPSRISILSLISDFIWPVLPPVTDGIPNPKMVLFFPVLFIFSQI